MTSKSQSSKKFPYLATTSLFSFDDVCIGVIPNGQNQIPPTFIHIACKRFKLTEIASVRLYLSLTRPIENIIIAQLRPICYIHNWLLRFAHALKGSGDTMFI